MEPSATSPTPGPSAPDYYHALFHRMDQGFCVLELLFDATGQHVVDFVYRQVNPVFSQQSGISVDVLGRSALEVMPDLERLWFDTYGRVARTGESERLEQYVPPVDRWFDVHTFRVGGPGSREVGVLFHDVTARKRYEASLALLSEISQDLVGLTSIDDTMAALGAKLGAHFQASACLFNDIDEAAGLFVVRHDWHRADVPSLKGEYRYEDFHTEEFRQASRAGTAYVVRDGATDPRVNAASLAATGIAAFVNVPLVRDGQWRFNLALCDAQPRDWRPDEVELLQELTARIWTRLERARAEEALRESETRRDLALETAELGTYVWHAREDRTEADARLLALFGRAEETHATFAYMLDQGLHPDDRAAYVDVISRAMDPAGDGRLKLDFRVVHPDQSVHWMASTGQALFEGQPRQAVRIIGTVADITERKQAEAHQAFLLRFSDALRAETGANSVADRALEMLREQLQLDRCYVGLYDLAGDRGLFPHQVGNHRIPPLPAEIRLSDFPDALRVAADRTLVIYDLAQTEGLSDTDRHNLGALGLRALVAATLRREGTGPQWAIVALSADVRHWTPSEVALLEEATERTWAALERARADEALHESEERFRAVANLGPDLLWRSTSDSDTTWYNQRWHEYTGQALADAAGYGWTNVIHADDQAESSRRYRAAIASGQTLRQEHRIRSAQGEYRWFQVQVRPVHNAQGEVSAWFGAATDIHARKQAEEALRLAEIGHRAELEQQVAERTHQLQESRHLLQTVFDASPIAIVVMRILRDAAGRAEDFEILIYNEFNKQVVGRDDLAGQRFTAMFPQTVPTGVLARLLEVATTGEPADFEQWYEGEGMRHWFRHIVVRQDGLLVLTSEVITARKLLEQGQTQSLALLQQSEAVAGMGSWEYNLRTRKFTWSDGLYRLFEQPVGSTIKLQFLLDTVLDDDRPAAARLVRTLTAEPRSFDTTLRLRIGEAVKTVRFKAVPLPEAPGPPERVLGVCLDVSDVQRLEAENLALKLDRHKELLLAILQAQETERQRLGEVLHNGLGQILYATKLRLDQLDSPALQALPALAGLHQETARLLAEAMRQNRTLAHELVPTSLLSFGLAAAVRDVCRDLSTPQLRIACHVWGEEPEQEKALPQPVQVTLFRLAQELAHNIARHAGATEATLELETMAGGVSLRAEDNGRGFDPRTVAEGLGLRTVRDAVALLSGTVAVDSSPEFGTHIRLRIPLPLFS